MNKLERILMGLTFLAIMILAQFDIITDLKEGVTWWHVSIEAFIGLIAGVAFIYLIKGIFNLQHLIEDERTLSDKLKKENEKFKQHSKSYIEGLSSTIDQQLNAWQLSKSEKEVAFLLLKGLSFKEIAKVRKTTEKTARTQSAAIYSKAGLANRSQLSAYFLEDLLLPNS
jgi:DNA-binding NarL/FixJ family response regulator